MCCGLRITCQDGNVLFGRTLEFGLDLEYNLYANDKIKGVRASVKGQDDSYFTDGINRDGLVVMAFYFPEFIQYANQPLSGHVNIQSLQMVEYLLSNASTIDDVYRLCKNLIILNHVYKPVGIVFPLHWICCDKKGRCIVIECSNEHEKGKPTIYENRYGIMTNSPTFPEHLKIISSKEVNSLVPYNNGNGYIQGQEDDYSNGTGLIGLPGDYTSISRFVKLYVLQKYHRSPMNQREGINTLFHILNNFDIVKGLEITKDGKDVFTQYTIVYDLSSCNAFYKTYDILNIAKF